MYCSECGKQIPDTVKFCPNCGAAQQTTDPEEKPVESATDNAVASIAADVDQAMPGWNITNRIGQGSYGTVYKAQKEEYGTVLYSAIKVIKIPRSPAEVSSIKAEIGSDEQSITTYFQNIVDNCSKEINLMAQLKGGSNIVGVEDYKIVKNDDGFGWTIYIRMELLQSFIDYSQNKQMTETEVKKLGIDICSALEYCHQSGIIHRDIKPENIFVAPSGEFKLGDFGIARTLEKAASAMSVVGTYNYMAPEVFSRDGKYDQRCDIYSLGLVLYKLLNNGRLPFVGSAKDVSANQLQSALEKRLSGSVFPNPANAGDDMTELVLTACAHNPEERFTSATIMKKALQSVVEGQPQSSKASNLEATIGENKQYAPIGTPAQRAKVKMPEMPKLSSLGIVKKAEKAVNYAKELPKAKKILYSSISALAIALIIGTIVFVSWYTGVDQKILRALESGDFDTAIEIFYSNADADDQDALVRTLSGRLDALEEDFQNNEIEYATVKMELSTIKEMGVPGISTKLSNTEAFIEELNDSRTAFNTAETFFEKGDYANAIMQYQMVSEKDKGNYDKAKEKLNTAIDKYRESVCAQADEFAASENYLDAISTLNNALEVVPNDSVITEKLSLYKAANTTKLKQDALDTAAQYAKDGDYLNAVKTISAALVGDNANDADLKTAYTDYSNKYASEVIAEADSYVSKRDYTTALQKLSDAQKVIPDNQALTDKYAAVEANKPVSLASLTALNNYDWSDSAWNSGTPEDPFGNTYFDVANFVVFSNSVWYGKEHYVEYRLYGEYKTLTGKYVPQKNISENAKGLIQVYADDTLVYTSPEIGRKTDMASFSVDISGAEYVKIVAKTEPDCTCLFMDFMLWKD